jgi:hypothetical protein
MRPAAPIRALAAVAALGLTAGAPAPVIDDHAGLVESFEQVCGAGPSHPDLILAAAVKQGWKPLPPSAAAMANPRYRQDAVWSKPDPIRGRIFLVISHGEAPYMAPTIVADSCQVVGPVHGVTATAKAIAAFIGVAQNTTVPGGQKLYFYANDASSLNRLGNPDPNTPNAQQVLRDPKVGLVTFIAVGHGGTIGYFVARN